MEDDSQRIAEYIKFDNWPEKGLCHEKHELIQKRVELTLIENCIMRGNTVIIPASSRAKILTLLHSIHPGMVRMEELARGIVW